jgi:hypothetical protein
VLVDHQPEAESLEKEPLTVFLISYINAYEVDAKKCVLRIEPRSGALMLKRVMDTMLNEEILSLAKPGPAVCSEFIGMNADLPSTGYKPDRELRRFPEPGVPFTKG